jgi:hypothetical protein
VPNPPTPEVPDNSGPREVFVMSLKQVARTGEKDFTLNVRDANEEVILPAPKSAPVGSEEPIQTVASSNPHQDALPLGESPDETQPVSTSAPIAAESLPPKVTPPQPPTSKNPTAPGVIVPSAVVSPK